MGVRQAGSESNGFILLDCNRYNYVKYVKVGLDSTGKSKIVQHYAKPFTEAGEKKRDRAWQNQITQKIDILS
ncbi:hypothetical protein H6F89_12025 [Cyanobacteria bacterium FACHB-63]|nr:hypothetical protein [Cyanobacteria bacterium FACHB-63]